MKAAIYCRLSKEDEDLQQDGSGRESESIQNQKSMLINYAIEKGFDIYHIYSDEDYSGVDRDRPDFNRMIEAASQHKFDIILAKTQSRFTRDMELVERYLHGKFVEWGIRFIAVVDHVDTADVGNKKSRQINGLINEWYLEDLSVNVRSVLTHKRKEGKYIGSFAPFGYQKDPQDSSHLVIDPKAAEVVKRIFAMYIGGEGAARIARKLNEEKIPTPTVYKKQCGFHYTSADHDKNYDLWGKPTIYHILCNQIYAGDMVQGRHKKASYKSKKILWVPKEEWIVVPDTHEGIVDRHTFQLAQQLLRLRTKGGGGGTSHPLARKIYCGLCGTPMQRTGSGYVNKSDGRSLLYFRCKMPLRDRNRCPGQEYMPVQDLYDIVLDRMRSHIAAYLHPDEVQQSAVKTDLQRRQKAKQDALDQLRREIARRRKAMQELYLDKSSGVIGSAQFLELNRSFLDTVAALEQQCAQLETDLGTMADPDGQRQRMESYLREVSQVKELNRELVNMLIERVIVYPVREEDQTRKVEIEWKF